jgi:hypothetical protein
VPAPAGSSPRQRRPGQKAQVQNLALSGIQPAKIKNSSVATAPSATSINRPAAAVATGASTVPAASATGATLTRAGLPWWVGGLGALACCALGWRLARGRW